MKAILVGLFVAVIGATLGFIWLWQQNTAAQNYNSLHSGEERVLENNDDAKGKAVDYKIEIVARNLTVPWSIAFTSPERFLVAERPGTIRVVENGELVEKPLIDLKEVSPKAEAGLMGLVLDPEYAINNFFYACYAYQSNEGLSDKVVKLIDEGSSARVVETLIEDIPAARFHAGCRLKIGPDEKLYITTGDATNPSNAQDIESLSGKILRLNLDGTIPQDNPFPNSPIYSYGHRNPQGLDWHPETKTLIATEHGPSGNDGPGGGDEINRIVAGGNYGWPLVSHEKSEEGLVSPLLIFTPAEAPASGMFYSGKVFPQFKNNFFFGALRGEGIIRLVLDDKNQSTIISYEKLEVDVGRIREVIESPEGYIYFSTSNQDGRGSIRQGDDKIYRLVPKN